MAAIPGKLSILPGRGDSCSYCSAGGRGVTSGSSSIPKPQASPHVCAAQALFWLQFGHQYSVPPRLRGAGAGGNARGARLPERLTEKYDCDCHDKTGKTESEHLLAPAIVAPAHPDSGQVDNKHGHAEGHGKRLAGNPALGLVEHL